MRSILIPVFAAIFIVGYGCATGPDADGSSAPPERGAPEPVATVVDARPAALVDGRSILWGELRPMLSEAAGAQVLREVALDRALELAIGEAGIVITPGDMEAERAQLLENLSEDPDIALRLLDDLRARQGLGPARFQALMYRNAALRALVRDRISVTEESIERMHDVLYGPRRQGRLMMLPTLAAAREAIERLEAGAFFGEVAAELSTDISAGRGGLLEPISRYDASYPEALRAALWSLSEGEVSSPILLNDQYALLMMERQIEGEPVDLEAARAEVVKRVRLQQERLLMDQLAREMIANLSVTIFDDSLRAGWQMRQDRGG